MGSLLSSPALSRVQHFPNLVLWRHRTPHLRCLRGPRIYPGFTGMEVHCCRILDEQGVPAFREFLLLLLHRRSACREGTTMGLFIPSVICLTIGNSVILAGNTSRSRIVFSSLFVYSKHFVQAGILKNSLVSFAVGFKFQNFG